MSEVITKPLGKKAYGSIGHLPESRMGPGDHKMSPGQATICTSKARDKHDRVVVQEKLDGSCCAVVLLDGVLHPLGRAGWPAVSSKYEQHKMFHDWAMLNSEKFFAVLNDGERIVGEWLAQAHSTRYDLKHEPFVAFDIMTGDTRLPWQDFYLRTYGTFTVPAVYGMGPVSPTVALEWFQEQNTHGAIDPIEGVVYRVERRFSGNWKVDFLAKYVRPEKKDGIYLPEISGQPAVWNFNQWGAPCT